MQGWWKFLIPLALGAAAAALNYFGRASDIEAVPYVGLSKNLRAGEEITAKHLTRVEVPRNMAQSMTKSAIPYNQAAVLYGRRARRAMTAGDVFLWSDIAPKNPWGKDEVLLQISLEGISLPPEIEAGQKVVFVLPENLADSPLGKEPKVKPVDKEGKPYRSIGPFRVHSIGYNIDAGRPGGGFGSAQSNVISLIVPAPEKGTEFDEDTHKLLSAVFRPIPGARRGAFFLYLSDPEEPAPKGEGEKEKK